MEPFPWGGQSCAEPAKTLSAIFYDFFEFLYPLCGTTDYTSRNASDIAAYSYVFALWFLFTTWHLWSEWPEGKSKGDANDGVSPQFFFSSDCLIAGTGDP
jgi:hypothetical protein